MRPAHPRLGTAAISCGAVVILLVLSVPPTFAMTPRSPLGGHALAGAASALRTIPASSTLSAARGVAPMATGTVSGNVTTNSPVPQNLSGVNVTLDKQSCTGPPSASSCPYVTSATTDSTGGFSLNAPIGNYFLFANNTTSWGGDWRSISLGTGGVKVHLVADPWVTYGNQSFVLPHWNNLSAYASNCNAQGPCGTGVYGTQVPLTAWTSDGVYYVNATDQLVYYSFANQSVRPIGPWKLLYDDMMFYQGIENTDWITADDQFVYEFGCATDCQTTSNAPIVFYAVNTTSGVAFQHTFTGLTQSDVSSNGQVQMIGENGNASVVALFLADGTVVGYNIWNRTQWTLASIDYFEANNIYYVPTLDSFIDIEAQGSSGDGYEQWAIAGPYPGTHLAKLYSGSLTSGYTINGVDGLYVNVTTHRIYLSFAMGGSSIETAWLGYDRAGVLDGQLHLYRSDTFGTWPDDTAPPNAWSSEHRPQLASDGPMEMGIWNGLFDNNSWLFDPTGDGGAGVFLESNLSQDHNRSGTYRQNSQSPASVEGLFLNASYGIISESINCRTKGTSCPIRGSASGSVPGTVWWQWRTGLSELPYPAGVVGAETRPPENQSLSSTNNSTSVTLHWLAPANGSDPIVNYTLFWTVGNSTSPTVADLWSQNSTFTVGSLAALTAVHFDLMAWNLHGHNNGTWLNATARSTIVPLRMNSFSVAPLRLEVGGNLTISSNVTGGTLPLTFAYAGLPASCPDQNLSLLRCRPSAAGTYHVTLVVTDTGQRKVNASSTVTVVLDLAVSAYSLPASPTDVGIPFSISTFASGGLAPYTIGYAPLPAGCASSNSTLVSCTPPSAGNVTTVVSVSDALGDRSSTPVPLEVNASPRLLHFDASPSPFRVQQSIEFTTGYAGGVPPFDFLYAALPTGCSEPPFNATSFRCTPTSSGSFNVSVTFTDSFGEQANLTTLVVIAENNSTGHHPIVPPPNGSGSADLFLIALALPLVVVAVGLVVLRRRSS